MRTWTTWMQNQEAVTAIAHLAPTSSCAVDEVRWQWIGPQATFGASPYVQAAVAGAAGIDVMPPEFEGWERDTRLYHWFRAQTSVKEGDYSTSLTHLQLAEAGSMLDAAGHTAGQVNHPECSVVNWTVASEIGYRPPPNGYVQGMMNNHQWSQVAEAFERLLHYDPNRIPWRLRAAEAYAAMGQTLSVRELLKPVLNYGTAEEIESANKLLQ